MALALAPVLALDLPQALDLVPVLDLALVLALVPPIAAEGLIPGTWLCKWHYVTAGM